MLRALVIACLICSIALGQSPSTSPSDLPVKLQLPNSEMWVIIKFYQSLTKRKVWIDADLPLDRRVSVFTQSVVPRAEAINLIRDTLEKEGVQIREVGHSEAYISRAAP